MTSFREKTFYIVFGVLILAGVVLRLGILWQSESFWFDEVVSVEIAQKPIIDSWQYLRYENNPPLHFWLLHFWGHLFGFGEFATRSLSVLVGLATLLAIYFLSQELFGSRTGLISAAILSLSPFAIFNSSQARPYALVFLFFILSSWLFFKLLISRQISKINMAVYVAVTTMALYSHLSAVALIAVHVIFLFFIKNVARKRKLILTAAIALPIVLFLPWLINFIVDKAVLLGNGSLSNGWYFKPLLFPILLNAPLIFLTSHSIIIAELPLSIVALFISAGLVFLAVSQYKSYPEKIRLALVFCVIGILLPLVVSSATFNVSAGRYYILSAIFFYILLAKGLDCLLNRQDRWLEKIIPNRLILSLFVWVTFLIVVITYVSLFFTLKPDGSWKGFSEYIVKNQPDIIFTQPIGWAVNHYLSPGHAPVVYYPNLRAVVSTSSDMFQSVVRYNWITPTPDDLSYINLQLGNIIPTGTRSLVYIDLPGGIAHFLGQFLERQGFRCKSVFKEAKYDSFFAVFMEKGGIEPTNLECAQEFGWQFY